MSALTVEIDLAGRVAVVTGGTRGIGNACARTLAQAGSNIVVLGRSDLDAATAAAEQIASEYGVESIAVIADSTDPSAIRDAYAKIRERWRVIDTLVNNAGILDDAYVGMITDDQVDQTLAVNTAGPIHHMQLAARLMRKSKSASIVNMASIIGRYGNAAQIVYGASKAGIIGATYSAAKELAPSGIRVNAIAPGFIDTDMTKAIDEDKFNERVASVKMGRIGTPQEVANGVLFLASDLSAYVTGQVIGVDGGMLV